MKHQYFGDVNDYRKYGLLRSIQKEAGLRVAVCWMLTPNDGRSDGKFFTTSASRGSGEVTIRSYLMRFRRRWPASGICATSEKWPCYPAQFFLSVLCLRAAVSEHSTSKIF